MVPSIEGGAGVTSFSEKILSNDLRISERGLDTLDDGLEFLVEFRPVYNRKAIREGCRLGKTEEEAAGEVKVNVVNQKMEHESLQNESLTG